VINIPKKGEEVVIHGPKEFEFGGRSATGRFIAKPLARRVLQINPLVAAGVAGGTLVVLIGAALLGSVGLFRDNFIATSVGLLLVTPPLVVAGYSFLYHSEELAPYRGKQLIIRTAICTAVYLALWYGFSFWGVRYLSGEIWNWLLIGTPFVVLGAIAAWASFDLDFGTGVLHYGFYLLVTCLLRWLAGLGWIWQIAEPASRV